MYVRFPCIHHGACKRLRSAAERLMMRVVCMCACLRSHGTGTCRPGSKAALGLSPSCPQALSRSSGRRDSLLLHSVVRRPNRLRSLRLAVAGLCRPHVPHDPTRSMLNISAGAAMNNHESQTR